jgi:OOP family OmpA-OmpF porin
MKIKGLFVTVFLLVTLFSVPVFANGPYIGVEGGLAVPGTTDWVHSISTLVIAGGDAELDTGFAIGGTVGYSFTNFRIEGELVYRNNDFDQVKALGISSSATGEVSVTSLLLNAYYDIEVSERISPYLGVGAGWSWASADLAVEPFGFELKLIDDESDSSPAVQLAVGIGISITPAVIIDVGYKYFWTEFEFEGFTSVDFSVADYSSHNFMVGVRYNF